MKSSSNSSYQVWCPTNFLSVLLRNSKQFYNGYKLWLKARYVHLHYFVEQALVLPSGAPEFTPSILWCLCCSIFSFMCNVLQIVVCPFSFGHCVVCSSFGHCVVCPSFGHCVVCSSFGHCVVCSSFGHCVVCTSICGFWLPLWYLQIFLIDINIL